MKEEPSRTPQQDAINITLCEAMAVCSVHMLCASLILDFVFKNHDTLELLWFYAQVEV